MSLPTDAAPPGHLPPAGVAPWPLQPPPHGAPAGSIPVRSIERGRALGIFAKALIGGAAAALVGLAVVIPLIVGREDAKPSRRRARTAKTRS